MGFSNTSNSTHPSKSCYFEVVEKLMITACALFFSEIALEIMILSIQTKV